MIDGKFVPAQSDQEVREAGSDAWTALVEATTARTTTWTGEEGRRYAFRVRARDVAGNVEAWSATPDAETTVVAPRSERYSVFLPSIRR